MTPDVDALLAAAGVQLGPIGPIGPIGPERLRLRRLCVERRLGGNDLPDAWLAAATQQLGERLVSFDRDIKKLLGRSHFTLLDPTPR